MTLCHKTASFFGEVDTPSRFFVGRLPVSLLHFNHAVYPMLAGNGTEPRSIASRSVAPSGSPATSRDIAGLAGRAAARRAQRPRA